MKRALIDHTGFVGATLLAAETFTHGFNGDDLEDLRGTRFDEVVCAGIPSATPPASEQDANTLLAVLETVRADRFVLLSSIEIYPDPSQPLDENSVPEGLPNHAHGRHHRAVEEFVAARFADHAVVRLPALFGDGLRANPLHDLLHNTSVETINPAATLQWYPTRRLPGDLGRTTAAGLRVVNLVTEPLALRDIVSRFFPDAKVGPETEPAPRTDVRTRHAALFGGTSPYIMGRSQVLVAMTDFIRRARRR